MCRTLPATLWCFRVVSKCHADPAEVRFSYIWIIFCHYPEALCRCTVWWFRLRLNIVRLSFFVDPSVFFKESETARYKSFYKNHNSVPVRVFKYPNFVRNLTIVMQMCSTSPVDREHCKSGEEYVSHEFQHFIAQFYYGRKSRMWVPQNVNQRKQNKTLVAKIKRLGVHDHARNQGDISRFDTLRLCATEKAGLLMSRYNLLLETQYMPAGPNFICACLFCLYSVTYGIHWSIRFWVHRKSILKHLMTQQLKLNWKIRQLHQKFKLQLVSNYISSANST